MKYHSGLSADFVSPSLESGESFIGSFSCSITEAFVAPLAPSASFQYTFCVADLSRDMGICSDDESGSIVLCLSIQSNDDPIYPMCPVDELGPLDEIPFSEALCNETPLPEDPLTPRYQALLRTLLITGHSLKRSHLLMPLRHLPCLKVPLWTRRYMMEPFTRP